MKGNVEFSIDDIFHDNVVFNNFCSGSISTIRSTRPNGIGLNRKRINKKIFYCVNEIGRFNVSDVNEIISNNNFEHWDENVLIIDEYFNKIPNLNS